MLRLIVICLTLIGYIGAHPILKDLLSEDDPRYDSFSYVLKWADENLTPKINSSSTPIRSVIFETGTSRDGKANCRGDGCSSIIFTKYIRSLASVGADAQLDFYSVDIDAAAIYKSRQAAGPCTPNCNFIVNDSIAALKEFPHKIDILYLDSYDFDSYNPGPSQKHHLGEIEVGILKIQPKSLILLDDCRLIHGGKCALVEHFLLTQHFVQLFDGYQKIFRPPLQSDEIAQSVIIQQPKVASSDIPQYKHRKSQLHSFADFYKQLLTITDPEMKEHAKRNYERSLLN